MTKTMPERHTKDYKIEGSYTWENYWFIPVVQLGSLLYGFNILYNLESGLPVETLETFSYWMELCGVLLIFADLVFRSKTENFLTYMEETGDPRSPNFIGWAKFFGIMLVIAVLTALSSNYMYSYSREIGDSFWVSVDFFIVGIWFGSCIYTGLYYPLTAKTGDRIAATGISLALTGVTFETSAKISIAFFS